MITTNTLKKSCIVDAAKALLNSPSLLTWPKETRVFVTVVPIFAPMTIGIAYSRLRTPLPTKPTIVDVVTDVSKKNLDPAMFHLWHEEWDVDECFDRKNTLLEIRLCKAS